MYSFGYLPSQGAQPQFLAYTYMPGSMVSAPIQTHNFSSQPLALFTGDQTRYRDLAAQFYTLGSYYYPYQHPVWSLEHMNPTLYYLSCGGGGSYTQSNPRLVRQSQELWSEGSFFSGELRWGRLSRSWSPIKELPGFVQDDLLRVYGTYPHTEVFITYHDGEFLVQGKPRVGQQEYRVERRVVRDTPIPLSSEAGAEASRGDDEAENNRGNQS
ncbi:uncharacterized protein C10orf95 homolog [Phascolarctos cinereus]|uniref:Uncharacterized protein LOC110194865 n=1 Tax=Phascolarctos cinereus TaxID=38626 RepID=A0A6P5IVZ4_PHACI|nr:uncharacterized protein LOC110194865 [Phascolarctos cinereus]XP_020823122.1 uncharacterized protein LOC110194865 [Phascolarctos cinereus]